MPTKAQTAVAEAMKASHSRVVLHPNRKDYLRKGKKIKRVTGITGMDGSRTNMLVAWAAKVERGHALRTVEQMFDSMVGGEDLAGKVVSYDLDKAMGTKKRHKVIFKEAGELGTATHNVIDWLVRQMMGEVDILTEECPPIPPETERGIKLWQEWAQSVDFKPLATETTMIHCPEDVDSSLWYAGTFDCLAEVNGVVSLCDWKTSSGIYNGYRYQIEAYRHAVAEDTENNWPIPEGSIIVLVPKDETSELQTLEIFDKEEQTRDLATFRALQQVAIRTDELYQIAKKSK